MKRFTLSGEIPFLDKLRLPKSYKIPFSDVVYISIKVYFLMIHFIENIQTLISHAVCTTSIKVIGLIVDQN